MNPNISESTLAKLKAHLEQKEKHLEHELELLKEEDSFADPDRVVGNAEEGEEAQEAQSHNENELKQESVLQSLGLVEKALAKINAGAYGMCEVNDKPHTIKKERLMAFPEAPTCLEHSPKQ